jgi:uncharacterized membrane protein
MGHLADTIYIDAPTDRVWEFAHDPRNWASYMVGVSGADKIVGDGSVGTEFELAVLMAGFHVHEIARLVEDRRDGDGAAHTRFDFEGDSSGWMAWDFRPEAGGTIVAVEEQYTVPGSVLGRVADRLVIERVEQRGMRRTLKNLKQRIVEMVGARTNDDSSLKAGKWNVGWHNPDWWQYRNYERR